MNEQLRRWLDDEVGLDELEPDDRREARRWGALFEDLRGRDPIRAPAGLESEVMRRIRDVDPAEAHPESEVGTDPGPAARALRWLFRPRPIPVPPAAGLAAAALALFLLLRPPVGADGGAPEAASTAAPSTGVETRVYAEFVLRAPEADSVAVAGTFTDWQPSVALEDPDGNGVWSARVPLEAGRHEYMFVVDGQQWVTDPNAERYASDGFGARNAVLAVASPDPRSGG